MRCLMIGQTFPRTISPVARRMMRAAALSRLLSRKRYRFALRTNGLESTFVAVRSCSRAAQGPVRQVAAGDRGRAGASSHPWGQPTTCHVHFVRWRIATPSSNTPRQRAASVVIGASFIGLEVTAAFRARGLEVHVVAPEKRPMERILGPQMGDFVRALHEEHGAVFHLDDTATAIDDKQVKLKGGEDARG